MKLPCPMIQDLLPLYADEICSAESHALVEEHLFGCDSCTKKLRDLQLADPEDEKKLAQAAAAAWKQSKRNSMVKTIAILLAAICLFAAVFVLPYTRWGAETTVRIWEQSLTDYAAEQLGKGPPQYAHILWEYYLEYQVQICPEEEWVFFVYRGNNTTGFFYTADGNPIGYQGHDYAFQPQGSGWYWKSPEYGNWMYAEHITGNWYWFEMST